jgi:hypothetical protein
MKTKSTFYGSDVDELYVLPLEKKDYLNNWTLWEPGLLGRELKLKHFKCI